MANSIIVAFDRNFLIGNGNKLPWHLPADLSHFKKITSGNTIVMGRKTYESIGKALPNRENIVISRNPDYKVGDAVVVSSVTAALAGCKSEKEIFFIGGSEIFKEALPHVTNLYLTRIDHQFEGDIFFPQLDFSGWKLISKESFDKDEKNKFNYSFLLFTKI
jgi:dihydrofolate reductase